MKKSLSKPVKPAPQRRSRTESRTTASFPVVGIGASAGGLEALTQLLKHLPSNTGMSFVLVQHLDPPHDSALASLLSRLTEMPVFEAKNNLPLLPNHCYVIPPNKLMGISERRLKLFPRRDDAHLVVDEFLRSLAEAEGHAAIGIILSGNGADGTQGCRAIKAAGGVTFAQDEKSAKYPSMPANAITAGVVDCVLKPEEIGVELARIAASPYVAASPGGEEVLRRSRDELEQHVKDRTIELTNALVALRASETRFRGFVESAPDAIVIADERGRIVLVNAQTERLFGYTRQELERRPMELLLANRFRRRHKEHRQQYLVESPKRSAGNSLELSGLRKDGSEFPIEISLSPLPTPDGRLVCGDIRDVTERKRADEALRESEARLTAIMEHTPALMFLKDTHGRYLHFNRQFAQTFHLELKQAVGKTDRELFPAAKHVVFGGKYAKVIRARAPVQFEIVMRRDDGPHTGIVTKFPLFTAAGKIYAVGGIITDITERKRVEEALQEGKEHYLALFREARAAQIEAHRLSTLVLDAQEQERKRISRELHDEVGQSLTAINMSFAALRRKVAQIPGSPMAELDDIQQLMDRTMEAVHNFARELRPSMLDELGLLPALRSHLKSLAMRTGLNLNLRADSVAEELGEEEKLVLFRIVQESLNNVVKHAGASRVELTVRKTDQGILVSIEDNGKSFRLKSNSPVQDQRLGLLGMRERVRLINGRFAIIPRPGKGTKVWATIPLKPPTVVVPGQKSLLNIDAPVPELGKEVPSPKP